MIRGAGILAGAYRGKDVSARTLLTHAVSDAIVPIKIGRGTRNFGEALCNRKYNDTTTLVDLHGWVDRTEIDCPRCVEILTKTGL